MESELDHVGKRLRIEGQKTIAFFEELSPTDWNQKIYITGSGWRTREVLAHFVSAERAYQKYLQDVLDGGFGAAEGLDIDRFNEADVATMKGFSPEQLIDAYRLARVETLHLTGRMREEDLKKVANHPWFGSKEISWYLKLLYRHNTMHRQDVQKSLRTGDPLPPSDIHRTGRNINP